ncbi:MAG: redox-sensing transcriptional repressor Rex [Oscillospiraceae bacterium]|jgi:redox-sensing transcriptional repressor|nr:redox-sensing transcriptional repressor Rex [Oscillospiraceae bacterium]
MNKKISNAVIRRLPKYYRYLDTLCTAGVSRISSHMLAAEMGLTASQIRQDLNCFGGFGQQGYGYNVGNLRDEIGEILGLKTNRKAIILGAGNLGRALINNFKFNRCGFSLCAAFDISRDVTGTSINNVPVYHMDELEKYVLENNPELAVFTLPNSVAQEAAKKLEDLGCKGIWNFSSSEIKPHGNEIKIENVHFEDSLMTLCYMINKTPDPSDE